MVMRVEDKQHLTRPRNEMTAAHRVAFGAFLVAFVAVLTCVVTMFVCGAVWAVRQVFFQGG